MRIPERGLGREEILGALEARKAHDLDWRSGRVWGYVYDPGPEAASLIKEAFTAFLSENALDPTAFPSLLSLENELVSMAAAHLRGDENVAGNFTSGGTESCMLAVKAARDYAREVRGIAEPEIVLPVTGHACFHKAAHYLDMKLTTTPVDPKTYKADPRAIADAIGPNTALVVGSAASYAHGVVDPIPEIAAIAEERGVLMHVDGCIGGFLLPFFRRLGWKHPDFDFSVPGVTSISMDYHKYAFAAKGASVILYRNKDLRRRQIFVGGSWTGYTVLNPTIQSTKSGGPLAAAWAILHFMGEEGYLKMARTMMEMTGKLVAGIDAIPGLRVLGTPETNLVAVTAEGDLNVFHLIDEMNARGWYIQPQLGYCGSRENFHLSVNPASERWMDPFLAELRECADKVRGTPPSEMAGTLRDMFKDLDPATLTPETFRQMLGMAGVSGSALPERMAEINEV
ncbi:MAG: aspartate aminotransferase family protein, partial [Candidatus Methylomirabilis sp.]|nr:aspartate aminotransferase family protein [Deltaproteobacteria bacterium]